MRFFFRGISEQAHDGVFRMERLQTIRMKYQTIVDADRNPERMSAMIDFLFSRPILSVRQASEGLGIPFKTAYDYFEKLEQTGILREITGHARNRIYQSDEIIRVIQV